MNHVRAKKHLGQHFLTDNNIANKIADQLEDFHGNVIEIGPGTGVLTQFLLENKNIDLKAIELDTESVDFLAKKYPDLPVVSANFLKHNLKNDFTFPLAIIGNFPYNISSQILFRMLEYRSEIPLLVGMFQKEMAERVCAIHGNKTYGILSVLVQAFYESEYLFTVSENVFNPPPKVKSGVIRLKRRENFKLDCNERHLFTVVKAGFNQRRKTLRNALRAVGIDNIPEKFSKKRAEQLSVEEFIELTKLTNNDF